MQTSVLILDARFYEAISEQLVSGACKVLRQAEVAITHRSVPGAFELPAALQMIIAKVGSDHLDDQSHLNGVHSGGHNLNRRHSDGVRFDGYVILGCLIRGETSHYELIASATIQSLQHLAVKYELALGLGLLTVENLEQAQSRASGKDAGGRAASTCLKMIALKRSLSEPDGQT